MVLPEKWNLLGDSVALLEGAEPLDGPTISAARSWARELGIHLVAGSIAERSDGPDKSFNTSILIGPDGELEASYRKIHMFDVDVGGVAYRESEHEEPGDEIVTRRLGGPLEGVTLGMSVCYDLRFPELYRILAVRGRDGDHRPVGLHPRDRQGPLGRPAARPGDREPGVRGRARTRSARRRRTTAPTAAPRSSIPGAWSWPRRRTRSASSPPTSTSTLQDRVRATLPSLANRRPASYRWPDEVRA